MKKEPKNLGEQCDEFTPEQEAAFDRAWDAIHKEEEAKRLMDKTADEFKK